MDFLFLICVFVLSLTQAIFSHHIQSATNKKYLINVIKTLNNPEAMEIIEKANNDIEDDQQELSDAEKERKLQEILKLIKKNYNANLHHEQLMKNPIHSGARLYFIRNPEVLEEYKKYLREKDNSDGSSSDGDRVTKFSEWRQLKRRAESDLDSSEESNTDNRRNNNGIKYKQDETTRIGLFPEKQIDILDKLSEKISSIEEDDKTLKTHNKRARDTQSDDIVKREKINWSESNEKVKNKKEKQNIYKNKEKIDSYKPLILKHKTVNLFDKKYKEPSYFKPKISYRKPKNEKIKDFLAFGRTSIPFIGKKGIYED